MSLVVQCDVCDKVVNKDTASYIRLYGYTDKQVLVEKDLCADCKRKLLKAFCIGDEEEC